VKDDAVHEPSETDPDKDSGRSRTACCLFLQKAPRYLPFRHGSHAGNVAHAEEAKTRRPSASVGGGRKND
jgi:hypothetical protein